MNLISFNLDDQLINDKKILDNKKKNILFHHGFQNNKLFDEQNSFKFVSPEPKNKRAEKPKPKKDKKDGRNGNSSLLSDRLMVVKSEG